MTYTTKCTGHCIERIDTQAETINKLRDESLKKTEALIKASKQIAQLQAEKRELTKLLNKQSHQVNMRADQNWDSRPRIRGELGVMNREIKGMEFKRRVLYQAIEPGGVIIQSFATSKEASEFIEDYREKYKTRLRLAVKHLD